MAVRKDTRRGIGTATVRAGDRAITLARGKTKCSPNWSLTGSTGTGYEWRIGASSSRR